MPKISQLSAGTTVSGPEMFAAVQSGSTVGITAQKIADGAVSIGSFTQSGSGAVSRTVHSKFTDTVSILDFGAVADGSTAYSGTNATTNATALMNALATGKSVLIPYNVNGYSFAGNTIALSSSQSIIGDNQVLLKCQVATSGYFIHVTSLENVSAPAAIDNVKIDMTGAGTTSTAIRFATSTGIVEGVQLSRLLFTNCVEAIGDEVHATNYVVDVKIYDVRCILSLGRQIYFRRSRGFMWIDTLRIDQTANTDPVTWAAAQFDDIVGLEINRFDCLGPVSTTFQTTATGLIINGDGSGQASVWLNRILVDNAPGHGISVSNVSYLNANWIESFQNLGNQIVLTSVARSELSNVFCHGAVGMTGAAAGANGFTAFSCSYLTVTNLISYLNIAQGVSLSDTTDSTFSNVQATNNGAWGFIESGTSNRNVVGGATFDNNTSGDITIIGAASQIINYTTSGTYVGASAWPVSSTLSVGSGAPAVPTGMMAAFKGSGTGVVYIGQDPGLTGYGGLWFGSAAPSGANYTFISDAAGADAAYLNHPSALSFQVNASLVARCISGNFQVWTTVDLTSPTTVSFTALGGAGISKNLYAGLGIFSIGPTSGIGYATGAGGAVTQGTSRATGVTLNTVSGAITLFSAAGVNTAATAISFTVTNSAVAATDTIIVSQKSGTDKWMIFVTNVAAGSFVITAFTTAGLTTEQPVFNFNVIKGVAA